MIGRVGANLKGIDLKTGADELRRALVKGTVEDLAKPASCDLPSTTPRKTSIDVGRIAIGAELAHKLRAGIGDCITIMVPFSSGATDAPVSYQFKVTGIFRMGFNEYDTRLAYVSIADALRLANVRRLVSGVELRFSDPMAALTRQPGRPAPAGQPAPPGRLEGAERKPVPRAAAAEGLHRAHPGDHRRGRRVQHRRVADDDRAVEGARGRDPEVDGRVVDDGRAHLPDRRNDRGPDRHRPRASATACSSACWRASTAIRWIRRCT